jgi:hypothetical protein
VRDSAELTQGHRVIQRSAGEGKQRSHQLGFVSNP